MVDPISALCIAALTQISGSMTAAGIAGGAIGMAMNVVASRADSMLYSVINATAGHFIRNIRDPANHDLLRGMAAAHQKAFRYYAETINSQASAINRPIADKIVALAKKEIPLDVDPTQALMASVTPLLAGSGNNTFDARRVVLIGSSVGALVSWIEAEISESLPAHFQNMLTETAPNGRESCEAKFQLHLAETIKTNHRYSQIFIASNIAELVGRTFTIEQISAEMLASLNALHGKVDQISHTVVATEAKMDQLVELVKSGALGAQMRDSKIDDRAFVFLARRINLTVEDDKQALAELGDAIERLLALEANGTKISNYESLVDQALKRMTEKAIQGDFDAAATDGARAFSEWEERREADRQAGIALAQATIEQHRFRRDMRAVSEWIVRLAALEATQTSGQFELLYKGTKIVLDRGIEQGINFDLGLASSLALEAIKLASNDDERGKARLLYGDGVCYLGMRSASKEPLLAAIKMYREALLELSRDRVPLEWAECQNCLGNALSALGTIERSFELLHEAETAFHSSLAECSYDRDPKGWTAATVNLGNVLGKLGRHDKDNARLEEAVTVYRSVLGKITRENDTTNWLSTQNNLGVVLSTLGERQADSEILQASITAFDNVLLEWTHDKVPLHWAGATANRCAAIVKLAELTGDLEMLTSAEKLLNRAGETADGRDSGIIEQCYIHLDRAAEVRAMLEKPRQ